MAFVALESVGAEGTCLSPHATFPLTAQRMSCFTGQLCISSDNCGATWPHKSASLFKLPLVLHEGRWKSFFSVPALVWMLSCLAIISLFQSSRCPLEGMLRHRTLLSGLRRGSSRTVSRDINCTTDFLLFSVKFNSTVLPERRTSPPRDASQRLNGPWNFCDGKCNSLFQTAKNVSYIYSKVANT